MTEIYVKDVKSKIKLMVYHHLSLNIIDKVPHKRLFWKLENVGELKGGLLKWREDFLSNIEMKKKIKKLEVRMVQCEK